MDHPGKQHPTRKHILELRLAQLSRKGPSKVIWKPNYRNVWIKLMSRWFKKSINHSAVWLTGIPLVSCFKGQAMFPFIASGRLENSNSKLKQSTVQQKDNGGKKWKSLSDKMSIFRVQWATVCLPGSRANYLGRICGCYVNCPVAGRCREEGTWGKLQERQPPSMSHLLLAWASVSVVIVWQIYFIMRERSETPP